MSHPPHHFSFRTPVCGPSSYRFVVNGQQCYRTGGRSHSKFETTSGRARRHILRLCGILPIRNRGWLRRGYAAEHVRCPVSRCVRSRYVCGTLGCAGSLRAQGTALAKHGWLHHFNDDGPPVLRFPRWPLGCDWNHRAWPILRTANRGAGRPHEPERQPCLRFGAYCRLLFTDSLESCKLLR